MMERSPPRSLHSPGSRSARTKPPGRGDSHPAIRPKYRLVASKYQARSNDHAEDADFLLPFERHCLSDPYREYLRTKRNNCFASIQKFPAAWKCFDLLDKIWARGTADLEHLGTVDHLLPLMLFGYAHANFRIALDLGFTGCTVEAVNVMRSGIESVAYARKILNKPKLATVWLEKDHGPKEGKAFNQAFLHNKKTSLFGAQSGLRSLHQYWSKFSEWGTHTTVSSLGSRMSVEPSTPDGEQLFLHSLETDPTKLRMFLYMILDAAHMMEAAFFESFESRLELDDKLVDMRKSFAVSKQQFLAECAERLNKKIKN